MDGSVLGQRKNFPGGTVSTGRIIDAQAVVKFGERHSILAQGFAEDKIFIGMDQPGVGPIEGLKHRSASGPKGAGGEAKFDGGVSVEIDTLTEGNATIPGSGPDPAQYIWIVLPQDVLHAPHGDLGTGFYSEGQTLEPVRLEKVSIVIAPNRPFGGQRRFVEHAAHQGRFKPVSAFDKKLHIAKSILAGLEQGVGRGLSFIEPGPQLEKGGISMLIKGSQESSR